MSTNCSLVLSIPKAAKKLGVSAPTLRRMVTAPGFPSLHFGKRTLIPVDELEKWIERHSKNKIEGEKDA